MSSKAKVYDMPLEPCGDETISGLSAVKSLTVPNSAIYAWIQAQTKDVRLRDSGTDPDATAGIVLSAGGVPTFYSGDLSAVRLIETAPSATVFVSYYKPADAAHGV